MAESARDRQLALAVQLGIEGAAGMPFAKLRDKINSGPPTAAQREFVTALLRFKQLPLPTGALTFKRAAEILDVVAPLVNDGVLTDNGWTEGDILTWKDAYYRIDKVHTSKMFTLARVELQRLSPNDPIEVDPTQTERKLRHPFTLHEDGAEKINLETYQP